MERVLRDNRERRQRQKLSVILPLGDPQNDACRDRNSTEPSAFGTAFFYSYPDDELTKCPPQPANTLIGPGSRPRPLSVHSESTFPGACPNGDRGEHSGAWFAPQLRSCGSAPALAVTSASIRKSVINSAIARKGSSALLAVSINLLARSSWSLVLGHPSFAPL